ncbi:hypothetical protein [Sphingomonas abaci]|uniref:Uncharacterized protein n=1 Tax=Sphingomonas abaci TaxID=237611 RepID=A0A7W7F266_9SPHN|nr:hypothetical protein [Sphingomonas abaci]MBB4620060.1 hypothetical protein [Sphingomonas abaci]
MNDIIEDVARIAGIKAARQFKQALNNPMTEMFERIIAPQLYRPNHNTHMHVSPNNKEAGRNHIRSRQIAEGRVSTNNLAFFSNVMAIPNCSMDEDGNERWDAPSSRVVWGEHQVLTFEFDNNEPSFFAEQLSWLRSAGKTKFDSPIGRLFEHCSQWVDFAGITVVYSGNKSFHIHICFATSTARAQGITEHVRAGLVRHWDRLHPEVVSILGTTAEPDRQLRFPEQLRRYPGGNRVISKPNHPLGIEEGQSVGQTVMWEHYRSRALRGSTASFFDPTLFVAPAKVDRAGGGSKGKGMVFSATTPELDFCANKMKSIYNERTFPAFVDFAPYAGAYRAYFTNHITDTNPASYMEAGYTVPHIAGSNPLGLTHQNMPRLPRPLGEMMEQWCEEFHAINDVERTEVERDFALAVTDAETARREMGRVILNTLRDSAAPLSWICAPEGISKSTSMFANHPRIDSWLSADCSGLCMYAFADYESAREKAEAFNATNAKRGYYGVVIQSFERLYNEACAALKVSPISLRDAANGGFRNILHAVEVIQPMITARLIADHSVMWAEIGERKPVLFTVHAVAHRWHLNSPSRLMAAASYWLVRGDDDHNTICRDETRLNLLIHDEVKTADLITATPSVHVQYVNAMVANAPEAWGANSTDRVRAYDAYRTQHPTDMAYGDIMLIMEHHGHDWAEVVTSDSGEYGAIGADGPYAAALGQRWSVIERQWPSQVARKVLVLTTETVPTVVARKCHIDWQIHDLYTPQIKRDEVVVTPKRKVTARNLPAFYATYRLSDPDIAIVGNKTKALPDAMTHQRARGSNNLIGRHVLQTMVFVSPDEFAYLEALNEWTGSTDLIRHRHIDEFNQTAGRNLGFRKRGDAKHYLVVNLTLFQLLVGAPLSRARYAMTVTANRTVRRKASALAALDTNASPLDVMRAKLIRQDEFQH